MKAVEKDVEDIFAEMELFLVDIAGDRNLSEEQCSRRDTLAEKVLRFRRQKDVLKSTSSFTCSSCLSRAYVEQVSNVAWPKVKYNRPRSNSYPFIKRLNPLPRVIEEDETAEMEKPAALPHARVPQVQTLNWMDTKISDEWLHKINTLRSTLTSLDSSRSKGSNRAERTPGVKCSNVDNKRAAIEVSNQDLPARCKSASIERLRRAVKEDHDRHRPCVTNEPISKTDHVRKPDSTYISLISGFTQKESQSRSRDDETHKHIKNSKKEKNCKNLKCFQMNMFGPRNLICSSQRSTHRQMSNSSEYIQQIASLGC